MIIPKMFVGNWVLENEPLPYILLNKISTNVFEQYSCVSRLEENTFRFNIYGISSEEIEEIIKEVEIVYDFSSLNLSNRTFNGILWSGSAISEVEPGIWQGIIDYTIYTEKGFSGENGTIEGTSIRDAIVKRAEQTNLINIIEKINIGFQLENNEIIKYPYVSVIGFDYSLSEQTTQTRQENSEYSFLILDIKLERLEEIVEEIENLYDYCLFNIENRDVLINEWTGNSIIELEPGIWQAECYYNCVLEKAIA